MNATTKRTRRVNRATIDQLAKSSHHLHGSFRRLNFESLEQRVYLASDVTNLAGYLTSDLMIISDATVTSDSMVVAEVDLATIVPKFVPHASSGLRPNLKHTGNFEFDEEVSSFEIPLVAENVDDESIVFVTEMSPEKAAIFETEVRKLDANRAQLIVRRTQEFIGTLLIRVGILNENQADSELWLDTKEVWVYINDLDNGPTADFSLTATKPDGSPITNLSPGDDFILHVWAQDLRTDPKGIFAAYLNINWDSELAIATGDIQHGERFFNGQSGDLSQGGLISEAGGFGGMAQSNGNRFEVFSIPMRATSAGELSLVSSPATHVPAHDVLAHGLDGGIGPSLIQFGNLHLTIAERSSTEQPDDGGQSTTTPSDPVTGSAPQSPPINPPPPLKLPADAPSDAIVGLGLTVTAPDGKPLQKPRAGDDFVLHVWAKDARQIPRGVLAAFLNVSWNPNLAVTTGPFSYGERYVNPWPKSEIQPGMIKEAGGLEALGHSQGEWLELFSVPLRATADGELSFTTTPSTLLHIHDIIVSGLDGGLDPHAVYYGKLSLAISEGEPSKGTERPPAAVSAPESPVISVSPIADLPIIVAISDDSEGGQFAVSVLELLSPAMQAEFASGLAATKPSVKDNGSRAALLSSANLGDGAEESPLPTTDRETDLAVVSRKPNADSTSDALANPVTAKTDLSLL